MPPERIASIVLGAGSARRFGGRKQLASLRGRPLLEHALAAAAAGPGESTLVVLGAHAAEIEAGIELGSAKVVRCRDWERGPGASLRAALTSLGPEIQAALVMLGDEPFVAPEASWRLVAARRPGLSALRATYHGRPGHPVLVERPLFSPLIAATQAGLGPAEVLRKAGVETVECGDLGDPADVDTPEQLAKLENQFHAQ